MAQVVFSFSTSDIIKVNAGVSTGYLAGSYVIQGIVHQGGTAKGIGCRIVETRSGKTIFNGIPVASFGRSDAFFPQRAYRAEGLTVTMSSGEAEIYLV